MQMTKHKPVTNMMMDFDKFYVIRMNQRVPLPPLYVVDSVPTLTTEYTYDVATANLFNSEDADEFVNLINTDNEKWGVQAKVTKELVSM